MNIPDNFTFRFGDMPKYTHKAMINHRGGYDIFWDKAYYAKHGADWFECTADEVAEFMLEEDGWEITE